MKSWVGILDSRVGKAQGILAKKKKQKTLYFFSTGFSKFSRNIIQKAFCRFQRHYPNSAFPEYDNRNQHAKPRR